MRRIFIFYGTIFCYVITNAAGQNDNLFEDKFENDFDFEIPLTADAEKRSYVEFPENYIQKRYSPNYNPYPYYEQSYQNRMDYGSEDPHIKEILHYLQGIKKSIKQARPTSAPTLQPVFYNYPIFIPYIIAPFNFLYNQFYQTPQNIPRKRVNIPKSTTTTNINVIPLTTTKTVTSTEVLSVTSKPKGSDNTKRVTTEEPTYIKHNNTTTVHKQVNKTEIDNKSNQDSNSLRSIIRQIFRTPNKTNIISNNETNASVSPASSTVDITSRIFLEDINQNWGPEKPYNNNYGEEDNIRPISFDAIKPEVTLSRPPPPVEHGSHQYTSSIDPSTTTVQTVKENLSECDSAIFVCCNQKPINYDCFVERNCPDPFPGQTMCDRKIVSDIYKKILDFYTKRN